MFLVKVGCFDILFDAHCMDKFDFVANLILVGKNDNFLHDFSIAENEGICAPFLMEIFSALHFPRGSICQI